MWSFKAPSTPSAPVPEPSGAQAGGLDARRQILVRFPSSQQWVEPRDRLQLPADLHQDPPLIAFLLQEGEVALVVDRAVARQQEARLPVQQPPVFHGNKAGPGQQRVQCVGQIEPQEFEVAIVIDGAKGRVVNVDILKRYVTIDLGEGKFSKVTYPPVANPN